MVVLLSCSHRRHLRRQKRPSLACVWRRSAKGELGDAVTRTRHSGPPLAAVVPRGRIPFPQSVCGWRNEPRSTRRTAASAECGNDFLSVSPDGWMKSSTWHKVVRRQAKPWERKRGEEWRDAGSVWRSGWDTWEESSAVPNHQLIGWHWGGKREGRYHCLSCLACRSLLQDPAEG